MDRAKTAVSSFDKQVEGIGKKFSTSFKDIFLSFLGPMALLGTAMGFIGKLIADNQKKHDDANKAAIDNTNALMSAEDSYWANKRDKEKNARADTEAAKIQRQTTTEEFLFRDQRGKQILDRLDAGPNAIGAFVPRAFKALSFSTDPKVQQEVQRILETEMKAKGISTSTQDKEFKAQVGFSNVVGVGANPVMEAMAMQLEETRRQTALLEIIARPAGGGVPVDFTKVTDSSPSRASMLSSK